MDSSPSWYWGKFWFRSLFKYRLCAGVFPWFSSVPPYNCWQIEISEIDSFIFFPISYSLSQYNSTLRYKNLKQESVVLYVSFLLLYSQMCGSLGGPLCQKVYLTCVKTVFCESETLATFGKPSFYEQGNYLVKIRPQVSKAR